MIQPFIVPIVIAALSFGSGWVVNGWRLSADISDLKAIHSAELKSISDAAVKQQLSLQQELDANEKLWATAEAIQYRKLRDAENEINQLRGDVAAGRKRLLINATCPASSDNMSETESSASMDNGASPELNPEARQNYYALRNGIERVTSQLLACQARLRTFKPKP